MNPRIIVAALCVVSACGAPAPQQKGVGFSTPGASQTITAGQRTPAAEVPASQTSNLPFYQEQTRSYAKRGRSTSERSAAMDAFRARTSFWEKGDSELVTLGKYRLKFRQVRVDTHDFIVAHNASHTVGAQRFNLTAKARQVAQSKTTCQLKDGTYHVRDGYERGMVFALSC
ncbi:hypothetical protein [uncultured Tateyamaria sp.]|uniref:hypothetical protein n=1 Tax=uncultured Tateyamaria sp. TaxID=455651 RepID=UPI002610DD32|nr:hypothetical protein [uncultured Tateyamaria sp.]